MKYAWISVSPLFCYRVIFIDLLRVRAHLIWLMAASSSSFLVANIFFAFYLGIQNDHRKWNFVASVSVGLLHLIYMVFFLRRLGIWSKKWACIGLGILVTIIALAAVFRHFKNSVGVFGAIFTFLAHWFRLAAVRRSPTVLVCIGSSLCVICGIAGSSLFFYKADWHVDIPYKVYNNFLYK